MTLTIMTPVFLIIITAIVLAAVLRGYKKGVIKSLISLGVLIASAFLGAGLSMLVSGIAEKPLLSLLDTFGINDAINDTIGAFSVIVTALVGMFANFICFFPCFIICYVTGSVLVSLVLKKKASSICKNDEYNSESSPYYAKNSKSFGAVIGVVWGLFLSAILLSPITGLLNCANDAVNLFADFADMEPEELLPKEANVVLKLSDDFAVCAVDALGGEMWFNLATTDYCYGEWTNINKELAVFKKIGMTELTGIMNDISTLDENSLETLDAFLDKISESPLLKLMLTAAVNDMSKAWINRTDFMGIERPDIGVGYINDLFDDILQILTKSTTKTVNDDLSTLLGLCSIFREYADVFEGGNYKNAADAFANGRLIEKLKKEIRKNPRMASLELSVDNIMMSAIANEVIDIGQYSASEQTELYENLADMLNSSATVSGDKRAVALSTDIYAVLSDYGVYAPEAMVNEISKLLISQLSANGETVTPESVRSYFEQYNK